MSQPAAAVPPTSVPGLPSTVAPTSLASAGWYCWMWQVSLGIVVKTIKTKQRNKKEEKISSDPAYSKVGDPSATPPSAPENKRPIYFKYAEVSMNLTMMVSRPGAFGDEAVVFSGVRLYASDFEG